MTRAAGDLFLAMPQQEAEVIMATPSDGGLNETLSLLLGAGLMAAPGAGIGVGIEQLFGERDREALADRFHKEGMQPRAAYGRAANQVRRRGAITGAALGAAGAIIGGLANRREEPPVILYE